jgi:hypothetical protein
MTCTRYVAFSRIGPDLRASAASSALIKRGLAMAIKNRLHIMMLDIMMLAAFAGATLVPAYATADDAQSEKLQRQIDALQRHLQSLQKQVSETKKAQREASAQAPQTPAAAAGGYAQAGGPRLPMKAPIPMPAGVKMSWGGFLAAEAVYRQHNTVSDIGTPFAGIPYPFSPQYKEPEFRGTARQSRI